MGEEEEEGKKREKEPKALELGLRSRRREHPCPFFCRATTMLLLLATLLLPSALGAAVCTVDASSAGCYVDAAAARILSTGVQGTPSNLSFSHTFHYVMLWTLCSGIDTGRLWGCRTRASFQLVLRVLDVVLAWWCSAVGLLGEGLVPTLPTRPRRVQ